MRKNVLLTMCLLAFTFVGIGSAFGQGVTTAGMSGKVKDIKGEALPGATIIAVHTPSGTQYGNVTDVEGFFRIPNMRVGGPYKVTVSFVGYESFERENVYLTLGQTFRLPVVLSESAIELEGVEIVADRNDLFNGSNTGASTVIDNRKVNTLPTVGRDLSDFTRLTPQAFIDNSDDDGPSLSVAGQNNRYNAIFIDGAVNNDVFGLAAQGTNGGQTGVSPISIDAIEQLSVAVAPYDVTLGGFTGGGVNAVTRSGTNNFEGSAYYFVRNETLAGQTPEALTNNPSDLPEFSAETYGFRIGGPIIKDKLFFFVNTEIQRNETPQPFDQSLYAGNSAATFDATVNSIVSFLQDNFGYEPGGFTNNVSSLQSEKVIAKFDYNINQNHKISLRHSYVSAENTDGFASNATNINFGNNSEVFPSETNSTALEISSNFGNTMSNKLILGYTTVRDDRGFAGDPFPNVRVRDGDGNFRFGSEAFSTANVLEQDVFTITNNFSLYKGQHTITVGTHNEFYTFRNLFIGRNFGTYDYNSVEDFLNQANPREFRRSFSLVDEVVGDASGAAAEFDAFQIGFYIQDEWQVNDKLKLTGGLRFDIPVISTDPRFADDVFTTTIPSVSTFYDLNGATPGEVPDAQLYFAPRFGFNYDVKGDQSTQIRGGLGIFTGRVPFVWAGGPFNNNGTNVGEIRLRNDQAVLTNGDPIPLRPGLNPITAVDVGVDPNEQIPSGRLELFDNDYRYPQVFRTSIAVDKKLPGGLIGTLEGIYTKKINDINHRNVNINPLGDFTLQGGADDRTVQAGSRIDPRYTDIILVENTNKGYAYNFTAQLQKPFDNGFTASVAWTFGESFTINDGTSSQLASNWGRVEHAGSGLNNLQLSRSDFDPAHRIVGFVSYQKEYANHFGTTVSLFANAQSGRAYSYVIGESDFVFDPGSRENALVYVPRSFDDINLVDVTDGDGNVTLSAVEQYLALSQFIDSDPYLRDRRGEYVDRNGARTPFEFTMDLRILQDFYLDVNGNRNTLQISLDIFNFTNWLNSEWGQVRSPGGNVALYEIANSIDADTAPEYNYFGFDDVDDLNDTFVRDSGINSARWQMQFGLRYIFGN
ncbi:MAG: carboxypeptidase regulatory-like domain-containing protein [Bacteroidota bacterium]